MAESMTKQELIAQLATMARTSHEQARVLVEGLVRIALREAQNGFELPGLCQLEISECRSPMDKADGFGIQTPAHRELRITPTQDAINTVNRMPQIGGGADPAAFKGAVNDLEAQLAVTVPPEPVEPLLPEIVQDEIPPAPEDLEEHAFITFCCANCGQEIEASTDMVDMEAQCPGCGSPIRVPSIEALTHIAQLASIEQVPDVVEPVVEEEPVVMPSEPELPVAEMEEEAEEEECEKGSTMRIEMPSSFDIPRPIRRTIVIKRRS